MLSIPVLLPVSESLPRLTDLRLCSLETTTPTQIPFPCSQHVLPSPFQHVLSQTHPLCSQYLSSQNHPRSLHLPLQIRLPCMKYSCSQIQFPHSQQIFLQTHFPRTQHKQEKILCTTHCPQLLAISRCNHRSLITGLFVPPPRKHRHHFKLALIRLMFGDCLSHSEGFTVITTDRSSVRRYKRRTRNPNADMIPCSGRPFHVMAFGTRILDNHGATRCSNSPARQKRGPRSYLYLRRSQPLHRHHQP